MFGVAWFAEFYRCNSWGHGRCGWCGRPPGPVCRLVYLMRGNGSWQHDRYVIVGGRMVLHGERDIN